MAACESAERNPPWRTSSTEITAGLYWSRSGIEERSFTFSTTMPTVVVSPGFKLIVPGSKRRVAGPPGVTGAAVAAGGSIAPTTGTPGVCTGWVVCGAPDVGAGTTGVGTGEVTPSSTK